MNILYGIQCTGNGHISRSLKIINKLKELGHTVDVALSGKNYNRNLPDVKYRFKGFTFFNTSKGGINYFKTIISLKFMEFLKDIKLDVSKYDKVISDFEPITAWACKLSGKKCYGISNQYSLLNKNVPKKGGDIIGNLILKWMAPVSVKIGLNYKNYDKNIFMPIISDEVLKTKITDFGHYTVYLPSYSLYVIVMSLMGHHDTTFHIFHGDAKDIFKYNNCLIYPTDRKFFLESFASSSGIITNAGFQTSSEALYMSKKLMVLGIKGQYEQECNVAALTELGVFSGELKNVGEFIKSNKIIVKQWKDPIDDILNIIFS